MKLNYSVKFRAFGVTFGTTSGSVDITWVLERISSFVRDTAQFGLSVEFLKSQLNLPVTLVDERGVKITLS